MTFRIPASMALLCMLMLTGSLQAQAGYHVDNKRGFKVKVPSKWELIPIDINEKWIVAKFLCDRSFVATSGDYPFDHRPLMRVIVFPDSEKENKGAQVTDLGGTIAVLIGANPHKDYRDFLRNTRSGFYFSKESKGSKGGLDYEILEATFDKDAAKYRLLTWVFRAKDADFAVEFEILDDHYDKLSDLATKALKSFRFITREGTLASGTTGSGEIKKLDDEGQALFGDRDKWRALPAKDRLEKRKAAEERAVQRYLDQLPDDWDVLESKSCLVISHADERYTGDVVDAVEACRKWLDKTFGKLTDEYAMKTIVRVCKDASEYRAYAMGGGGMSFSLTDSTSIDEIVTYKDVSAGSSSGMGSIFRSMAMTYLYDKDRILRGELPEWFEAGMSQVLESAKPKGRNLDFEPDSWENDQIRDAKREDKLKSARELMTMTTKEFSSDYQLNSYLSARFFRYIIGNGGQRQLKDFEVTLLRDLIVVLEEQEKKEDAKKEPRKEAQNEQEEEEAYKQRRAEGGQRQKELAKKLEDKIGWKDKDWDAVEKAYKKAVD